MGFFVEKLKSKNSFHKKIVIEIEQNTSNPDYNKGKLC